MNRQRNHMKKRGMRAFAAISTALLFAALGCGGGGGGTSCTGAQDITGIWSGPATNDTVARGNSGTITASIEQAGCELGGIWDFVFQDPTLDRALQLSGAPPQGTDVFFKVFDTVTTCDEFGNCAVSGCIFDVNGTLIGGNEIVGTYVSTNDTCAQSRSGDFDIVRIQRFPTPVPTAVPTPTPSA
jgi:hypothetical protein